MNKRYNVFMRIGSKYPGLVTCYFEGNRGEGIEELHLGVNKIAPEDVVHLVKAAKKYYNLVVL
jgi:hypothetical protein